MFKKFNKSNKLNKTDKNTQNIEKTNVDNNTNKSSSQNSNIEGNSPTITDNDDLVILGDETPNGDTLIDMNESNVENFTFQNNDTNSDKNQLNDENVLVLEDGSKLNISDNAGQAFKKNKNGKSKKEFITMEGDIPTDDFIIIGNKKSILKPILTGFKAILIIIITAVLIAITYFSVCFRLVPGDVKGSEYKILNYSVVSRNSQQANIDELNPGDKIICYENDISWFPIVLSYNELTFKSREGYILTCEDNSGKNIKIQSTEVAFILR